MVLNDRYVFCRKVESPTDEKENGFIEHCLVVYDLLTNKPVRKAKVNYVPFTHRVKAQRQALSTGKTVLTPLVMIPCKTLD